MIENLWLFTVFLKIDKLHIFIFFYEMWENKIDAANERRNGYVIDGIIGNYYFLCHTHGIFIDHE